jgi:hypothetical protein
MRYFYSLNVIISHLIVHKEGLGYLSVCAIASRSSPPSTCVQSEHKKLYTFKMIQKTNAAYLVHHTYTSR